MADPVEASITSAVSIDWRVASAVGAAAVSIVVALWVYIRATVQAQLAAMRLQISELKGMYDDAVHRIRELEEARLKESKENARAYNLAATATANAIVRMSTAIEKIKYQTPLPFPDKKKNIAAEEGVDVGNDITIRTPEQQHQYGVGQ